MDTAVYSSLTSCHSAKSLKPFNSAVAIHGHTTPANRATAWWRTRPAGRQTTGAASGTSPDGRTRPACPSPSHPAGGG
jgi:hypothetical protein